MLFLVSALSVLAVAFGGATRQGFIFDAALQVVALVTLVFAISDKGVWRRFILCAGGLSVVAAVQLLGWWSRSFGPAVELAGTKALDLHSVVPLSSIAALLSLLPAIAVFSLMSGLTVDDRRRLCVVLLAFGAFSIVLGLAQLAQGPGSLLRVYAVTNPTEAVGLFANRNHLAALLAITLVFGATYASAGLASGLSSVASQRAFSSPREMFNIVLPTLVVFGAIVGVLSTRSRAGVLLAIAGLVASAAIIYAQLRRGGLRSRSVHAMTVVGGLVVLLAIGLGLNGVLARFEVDVFEDGRSQIFSTTIEMIWKALPFGSGLASFPVVYGAHEPVEALVPSYVNRAHNDWLELVLEMGFPAVVIMAVFLAWLTWATVRVFVSPRWSQLAAEGDVARGAAIAIWLLLAHSLVDYPLRTTALQVVFAICCGLLFLPRPALARRSSLDTLEPPLPVVVTERRPWTGQVEWPKDWLVADPRTDRRLP